MRITEKDIRDIIRHINTLESHVNPQDSANFHGELWSYDYFAREGVYIRCGHENPTHTSYRIPIREAWLFLIGVQYILELEYRKLSAS